MKKIKKIIFILFIIILIIGAAYLSANCIKYVPEGSFTAFKDNRTGDVGVLFPGIHFLIQGIYPERVILRSFKQVNTDIFNIKTELPPFDTPGKDSLSINTVFTVSYSVNFKNIQISGTLPENISFFNDNIEKVIKSSLRSELTSFVQPLYRPDLILKNSDRIKDNLSGSVKRQCEIMGLDILKFEISGQMELPLKDVFERELKELNELKDIEKNNKKELLILESKLLNEQRLESSYYQKLDEISKIIKKNPDILKYLYIDKMADNVKVIITSDKNGFPLGLSDDKIIEDVTDNSEIDNLRK